MSDSPSIEIRPDGPYLVSGAELLRLRARTDAADRPVAWEEREPIDHDGTYALCRCGASGAKPFCDGSHREVEFDGAENGPRTSTAEQRRQYGGDLRVMTDHEELCSHAGFCSRAGTNAWKLAGAAELSSEERDLLVAMSRDCPSGRLALHEPPDAPAMEPDLPRRIGVIDDGPLYVQGAIPLRSADGEPYEARNRMTLCRCGASDTKPFCDGAHADIGFRDS